MSIAQTVLQQQLVVGAPQGRGQCCYCSKAMRDVLHNCVTIFILCTSPQLTRKLTYIHWHHVGAKLESETLSASPGNDVFIIHNAPDYHRKACEFTRRRLRSAPNTAKRRTKE